MDTPVFKEPLLGYYPCCIGFLTGRRRAVDGTVSVGQFDWGGRVLGRELANMIVDTYLEAEFQGGRHADRIKKIHEIETM